MAKPSASNDAIVVVAPHRPQPKLNVIAMVHVHSTTALLAHSHTARLGVPVPTAKEQQRTTAIVARLNDLYDKWEPRALPFLASTTDRVKCRSALFLDPSVSVRSELAEFASFAYVQYLTTRALEEVRAYTVKGIRNVEIENVAAPYFLGSGSCPWEELLCQFIVATAIRKQFPDVCIGLHVLSCNEIEALPTALACGAYFIRSEASLFTGLRPEGPTQNHSNLARFFYLRRVLRAQFLGEDASERNGYYGFPKLWTDFQKKHTVFQPELQDLKEWLHNISFCKLEGVIITGPATGSDAAEDDLNATREAIDEAMRNHKRILPVPPSTAVSEEIPLVTGSGDNLLRYAPYADFSIIGSAFKHHKYWENDVSDDNIDTVLEALHTANDTWMASQGATPASADDPGWLYA